MRFSKYEATGNDFIIIDAPGPWRAPSPDRIRLLCDRHRGVGADGVLFLVESVEADIGMRMFNPDGSEAEMCGNGIRALCLFAVEKGRAARENIRVETRSGIKEVAYCGQRGKEHLFRVAMGVPSLKRGDIPMQGEPQEEALEVEIPAGGEKAWATCVSMGNPHCVLFVENVEELESFPLRAVGPAVETNALFPARTNVEVVAPEGKGAIRVRVWERGAGETLSCGTGACAALVAATRRGLVAGRAAVRLPGGSLDVEWTDQVYMTGPARQVFHGEAGEDYEPFAEA